MKSILLAAACVSILFTTGCATAHRGKPSAIQIDLGKLLDARVVITQTDGRLQMANYSLDRGDSSVLISKSRFQN